MGESQIFILDIGASKVSAALAISGKQNRIFDIFSEQIRRRLSENHIQYTSDLSSIITSIKSSLEQKSGCKLREVFVNIDSEFVSCQMSRAAMALVERSLREVTFSDIKRIESQARSLGLKMDEEVLHQFPVKFTVDSSLTTLNPIGKLARKLEVDLFIISAKTLGVDNLVRIISQAGLKAKRITFSGLASAAAILKDPGNSSNAVAVDIGAANTKVVTFSSGAPKLINIIPFAGNNITFALANSMKLSVDLAEELKKSYASVTAENLESAKDIMVKTSNSYKSIRRCELCKSVLPSVEKLVFLIKDCLANCPEPVERVFVCGGTALLDGLLEFMESKIGCPVILGRPDSDHLPMHKRNNFFKSPAQATLLGMLVLALEAPLFTSESLKPKNRHMVNRVIKKARQVYYDYF